MTARATNAKRRERRRLIQQLRDAARRRGRATKPPTRKQPDMFSLGRQPKPPPPPTSGPLEFKISLEAATGVITLSFPKPVTAITLNRVTAIEMARAILQLAGAEGVG